MTDHHVPALDCCPEYARMGSANGVSLGLAARDKAVKPVIGRRFDRLGQQVGQLTDDFLVIAIGLVVDLGLRALALVRLLVALGKPLVSAVGIEIIFKLVKLHAHKCRTLDKTQDKFLFGFLDPSKQIQKPPLFFLRSRFPAPFLSSHPVIFRHLLPSCARAWRALCDSRPRATFSPRGQRVGVLCVSRVFFRGRGVRSFCITPGSADWGAVGLRPAGRPAR